MSLLPHGWDLVAQHNVKLTGSNGAKRHCRPVERFVRRLAEVLLETVCQATGRLLADSSPEQVQP
jgi:hypothetical protein